MGVFEAKPPNGGLGAKPPVVVLGPPNGGLGAKPPAGVLGAEPPNGGVGGEAFFNALKKNIIIFSKNAFHALA